MTTESESKKPDFLDLLAGVVTASLIEDLGLSAEDAAHGCDKLIDRVRREFGGVKFYIPSRKFDDVERMRQEIGRRWDGRNTRELCREFGISETWLRELYDQSRGVFVERRRAPRFLP